MTEPMPRQRKRYLHFEMTRHDKPVWYVRIGKGARIRIKAEFGTDQFEAEYAAAISGDAPKKPAGGKGTLAWVSGLYQQSSAWLALAPATRRQRSNILKHVLANGGDQDVRVITKAKIIEGRERRATTPAAARNFIETMRGLFKWAKEAELVSVNPCEEIVCARIDSEGGFPVWEEEDFKLFSKRWPLGTRQRLACDLLYYTGLRRGDAVVVGRQHVKNNVIAITTEKTKTRVYIAIEPELAESIAATKTGELTFICRDNGDAFVKEGFGNWFRDACNKAGVKKSAHGLRKAGATRDAERGWSEAELDAKYGWTGGRQAASYTREMNRERLSVQASMRSLREQALNDAGAGGDEDNRNKIRS